MAILAWDVLASAPRPYLPSRSVGSVLLQLLLGTKPAHGSIWRLHNTARLLLSEGDDIYLHAFIFDHDWKSSDDAICINDTYTDGYTATVWASFQGEDWLIPEGNDFGSGTCRVRIEINAVKP